MNNNTSFQIASSYENFYLISQYNLISNFLLQNKIKKYILTEINELFLNTTTKNLNTFNSNNLAKEKNLENKKEYNNLISKMKENKINIINSFSISKNSKII